MTNGKGPQPYIVILAGGVGTRLWPRSRQSQPKQLLDLVQPGTTMLQETYTRIRPLTAPERICVVASDDYREAVLAQLPEMPPGNFIAEPAGRGTAPAIGLATLHVQRREADAIMAVLPADHVVLQPAAFRQALAIALDIARGGRLAIMGIQPTGPETGFGYIERGARLDGAADEVYQVARFVEKPDHDRALQMVASGHYYWNGGMFIASVAEMMTEIARHLPALAAGLAEIGDAIGSPAYAATLARLWPTLPAVTIDYGVMEKAQGVAVVPLDAGWSDVGNWDALAACLAANGDGNVVIQGEHLALDTQGAIIYTRDAKRVVATVGVQDLVIIDTGDALLVCPKSRAQDVRHVVERLKKLERHDLL